MDGFDLPPAVDVDEASGVGAAQKESPGGTNESVAGEYTQSS